jgi:hypothetical protein
MSNEITEKKETEVWQRKYLDEQIRAERTEELLLKVLELLIRRVKGEP